MPNLCYLFVVLLFPLLLICCEGRNIWSSFLVQSEPATQHSHQPAHAAKPSLCSRLLTILERVNTATPDTCQPLPAKVSGECCLEIMQ